MLNMKIAGFSSSLILVIAAVAAPTNASVAKVDDSPVELSRLRPQGDPDRYIVTYRDNRGVVEQNGLLDGQVHFALPAFNAVAATIAPEKLAGLRSNPDIESIEKDVLRFTAGSLRGISSSSNPKTTSTRSLAEGQQIPYGVHLVQADQVPMGTSFVPKICIIDSGYNLGHEDLPGGSQVTGDSDIGGSGEWFDDGSSHGTHVAGMQFHSCCTLHVCLSAPVLT
jgi:subtilisin family serine protease